MIVGMVVTIYIPTLDNAGDILPHILSLSVNITVLSRLPDPDTAASDTLRSKDVIT